MAGTLQVYSYNRCSTCRKALAWLTERGIAHEVHDITLTPPSKEMLVAAHQSLGDRKLLFNTSGQSYRAMGAAAVKALSDDEALEAFQLFSRTEGIIPALESAHALAWVSRERQSLAGSTVLVNLSGRGDKDVGQMMEVLADRL